MIATGAHRNLITMGMQIYHAHGTALAADFGCLASLKMLDPSQKKHRRWGWWWWWWFQQQQPEPLLVSFIIHPP